MPEGCRRNDRPTARWVSRTRGGPVVESLTRRFMTRRLTPARATSSRPRPSPARLFIVFETTQYTESSPLSPRARARNNRHTTGHDSPSSPLGGASTIARANGRFDSSGRRARERPGGEASAREARRARGLFFARSPFGRRSVADRTGTAARGRSSGTAREDARNRGHGDCRWSAAIGRGTARCGR